MVYFRNLPDMFRFSSILKCNIRHIFMEKAMKDESSKRQKFVELANARVNRALKEIQLIGNLSNKRAYDYTDRDAKQIIRAIESELDKLREKFKSGSDRGSNAFRLEE